RTDSLSWKMPRERDRQRPRLQPAEIWTAKTVHATSPDTMTLLIAVPANMAQREVTVACAPSNFTTTLFIGRPRLVKCFAQALPSGTITLGPGLRHPIMLIQPLLFSVYLQVAV